MSLRAIVPELLPLALALALAATPLRAQDPATGDAGGDSPAPIAVLPFDVSGAEASLGGAIAEQVRAVFIRSDGHTVVDRTLTEQILEEWEFQQSGVNRAEQAVEIGRLHNVRFLVAGKVIRFGSDGWLVSAALLDTQTGETVDAHTLRHRGAFFDLLGRLPPLTARLAGIEADAAAQQAAVRSPEGAAAPPPPSPDLAWQRTFGGSERDQFNAAAPSAGGGALLAGSTRSRGDESGDGWLVRVDAGGDPVWQRTHGGSERDRFNAVAPSAGGGTLLAGSTRSGAAGGADGWLVRVDARGDPVWQRTHGGSEWDEFNALAPLAGGGALLAGWTASRGDEAGDGWVVRVDAEGHPVWQRAYGGSEGDGFNAVAPLAGGGALLAGETENRGPGKVDDWLVRVDAGGDPVWQRTYGGSEWDRFYAAAPLAGGGALLAGRTASLGAGSGDGWLVKLSPEQ